MTRPSRAPSRCTPPSTESLAPRRVRAPPTARQCDGHRAREAAALPPGSARRYPGPPVSTRSGSAARSAGASPISTAHSCRRIVSRSAASVISSLTEELGPRAVGRVGEVMCRAVAVGVPASRRLMTVLPQKTDSAGRPAGTRSCGRQRDQFARELTHALRSVVVGIPVAFEERRRRAPSSRLRLR